MSEIASFFDSENSVTAKWLSNVLDVSFEVAQKQLSDYKNSDENMSASFVLSGEDHHGGMLYVVTQEHEESESQKSFRSVRSKHLHALHKLRSESYRAEIEVLELEQASDLLMMGHSGSASFYKNANAYICCSGIEVKPIGQRILSSSYSAPVAAAPAVALKEVVKTAVSKVTIEKAAAPAPAVLKSKSSIQVSSFFSAAPSVKPAAEGKENVVESKPAPAAVKEEIKEEVKVEVKEPVAPKRVGRVIADDDDEEWESEYKVDANRLKERVDAAATANRRNIRVGAADDEMNVVDTETAGEAVEVDDDEEEASTTGTATGKGTKRKAKVALAKHGAMDDYFEDVAIAAHKRAQETGGVDAPKPKKRKLVEKMFADEKGYLVTSMVWEEVTDDEGDSAPVVQPDSAVKRPPLADVSNKMSAPAATEVTKKPATAVPAKAKKTVEAAKAGGQQKSMMSFFGKKP